jgi:glucose-1-phosphate thymidylyltransferase
VIERSIVGPYASIGPGAVIRDAVVTDAIIEDGARIEKSLIEHSIVGRNAQISGRPAQLNVGDDSTVRL